MDKIPAGHRFDLVLLAASTGGVQALGEVLSALPADFPAALALVLHRKGRKIDLLPAVLARRTGLPVKAAEENETIRPGVVYVAPADWHLTIGAQGRFAIRDGTRIHHVLSSANPLFESGAEVLGKRLIAVVLTGWGGDATDGVQAVKQHGGVVIAQDSATSAARGMPQSAIATGSVDYVLPLAEIGPALVELATTGELIHRRPLVANHDPSAR